MARASGGPDPAVRLLRRLGHQLRSPLTPVVGFAAMLTAARADQPDHPGVAVAAGDIAAAAHRVQLVVDTVVTWASPWPVVRLEPVDLPAAVTEALEDLTPAGADPVAVRAVAAVTLRTDPVLLRQLLRQLLDNAFLHAVPEGRPEVVVSAGASDSSGRWWLRVIDDGRGVPPGERARVVQPYVRLDRDSHRPGAGVGLAIADRVAAAHRGRLWLAGGPRGGTAVTVEAAPGG